MFKLRILFRDAQFWVTQVRSATENVIQTCTNNSSTCYRFNCPQIHMSNIIFSVQTVGNKCYNCTSLSWAPLIEYPVTWQAPYKSSDTIWYGSAKNLYNLRSYLWSLVDDIFLRPSWPFDLDRSVGVIIRLWSASRQYWSQSFKYEGHTEDAIPERGVWRSVRDS